MYERKATFFSPRSLIQSFPGLLQVRFTEPVVICSCEFLELQSSSLCPTLSLSGLANISFFLEAFRFFAY